MLAKVKTEKTIIIEMTEAQAACLQEYLDGILPSEHDRILAHSSIPREDLDDVVTSLGLALRAANGA